MECKRIHGQPFTRVILKKTREVAHPPSSSFPLSALSSASSCRTGTKTANAGVESSGKGPGAAIPLNFCHSPATGLRACQPAKERRQRLRRSCPGGRGPSVQFCKQLGSIFHRRTAGGAPKIAKGRMSETGILPLFLRISTQRIQLRER